MQCHSSSVPEVFDAIKPALFPDHCPKFNRYHFLIHIFPKIQKMCLHPDRIISLYRRFAPYICDTVIPFIIDKHFCHIDAKRRQKFFLRWDQIDRSESRSSFRSDSRVLPFRSQNSGSLRDDWLFNVSSHDLFADKSTADIPLILFSFSRE